MPIKKGSSKKVISENISEIMHSYKKKGKIGTSKPKNDKAALKQAEAIAIKSANKPKKKKSKK